MSIKRVSSTDIARAAGVSQATVSYVINSRSGKTISEKTKARVLSAARDLGYQPNAAARALATGKTGMVALWLPNAFNIVFSNVTGVVMRHVTAHGSRVIISQTSSAQPPPVSSDLSDWHVDGVIGHDTRDAIELFLQRTRGATPVVSMGPTYSTKCDCVGVDLYEGSVQGVKHLVDVGCRRIAMVTVHWAQNFSDVRYRAFMEVCEEASIEPQFIVMDKVDRREARQRIAEHIAGGKLDGLFCWNDEVATSASMAVRDVGLRCPEDIAIIGSDGVDETEYQHPSLTTIAQPFEEMVEIAWSFLRNRMQEPDREPQQVILPMKLIKRQSTVRQ